VIFLARTFIYIEVIFFVASLTYGLTSFFVETMIKYMLLGPKYFLQQQGIFSTAAVAKGAADGTEDEKEGMRSKEWFKL